jgi:uncharacterized protein (DUF433 family)
VTIQTEAGLISATVEGALVAVWMPDPKIIDLQKAVQAGGKTYPLCVVDTGVPHAVLFVEHLARQDVEGVGRQLRFHEAFLPHGTNVNFVETLNDRAVAIRTYERGVESETSACGTGAVAAAIAAVVAHRIPGDLRYEPIDGARGRTPAADNEGLARHLELRPPRIAVDVQTHAGETLHVEFSYHNPEGCRALVRDRIVTDPQSGQAVVKGAGIPVQRVWDDLRELSVEEILRRHPALTELDVRACLLHVTAPRMLLQVVVSRVVLGGPARSVFDGVWDWSTKGDR